ncbi:MAG: hypothetical protein WD009_08345 [Phycisphaeraceae bacterium]
MPIFLDDTRTELAGDDLADVLEAARTHLAPRDRVVVEVEIDGQTVPASDLEHVASQRIAGREIRLTSADPRQLVGDTLLQVQDRLEDARKVHEHAAERLQADDPADAMQSLSEAIEIWIQTQQTVLHASMLLGLDLDALTVADERFDQLTARLLERLQSLKAHLESQDTVALADELAYEWPPTIDRWQQLVTTLITHIQQPPPST